MSDNWMVAKEVAEYLKMGPQYFADKFCYRSDFPKAVRFTDGGVRRWKKSEIDAWVETRREAA